MMLANDLKTYYDEVRRYLDCPKDEQDRLLLSVNKQVIELQVDNPNLDYDGIVEFLGEPESLAASLHGTFVSGCCSEIQEEKASSSFEYHCLCRSCGSCFIYTCHLYINYSVWCQN